MGKLVETCGQDLGSRWAQGVRGVGSEPGKEDQGQVLKGQVEELASFKGEAVLPRTPAAAQCYVCRAHPLESAFPSGLAAPRSLCLLSRGQPATVVWKETEGVAICSLPTNILGRKSCFFSMAARQGTLVETQRPSSFPSQVMV